MVQEHKSLWRIKNNYLIDSGDCQECLSFWQRMEEIKENQIAELEQLIKKHLQ
jgi:hypothetical protein